MSIGLLLRVKLRLVARSFLVRGGGRRSPARVIAGLGVLAAVMAPMWLGFALSAHQAVAARGLEGLAAVYAAVQLGWLFTSLVMAGFAEGFDWRLLLRFPVPPSRIFIVNLLIAPLDLVALFLLPPLVSATLAAGRTSASAALGAALGALLLLLVTAALLQTLLAGLGRLLRRDWTRALGGLAFGVLFTLPVFVLNRQLAVTGRVSPGALLEAGARPAAAAAEWLPTTALPLALARGLWAGSPISLALGLVGSCLLLALLVHLGTRLAVAVARSGEAAEINAGAGRARPGAAHAARRAGPTGARVGRRLPADLAILVGRDLRYFVRTPQILLGLFLTPVLVTFFYALGPMPQVGRFSLPFFCLVSALNLSANQFGLDREGIRQLLLLPVTPRRLLVSKNLACGAVVLATTALAVLVAALVGRTDNRAIELASGILATFAALPLLLALGNFLSVRHPWRMTFKVGGAPPGALTSAAAQFGVVLGVAVLVAIPAVVGLLVAPEHRGLIELTGTTLIALPAWALWAALLAPAARYFEGRKEHLLATLAYPHETG